MTSLIPRKLIIVLAIFGILTSLFFIGRFIYLRQDCCQCGALLIPEHIGAIGMILNPTLYDCCACSGLNSECCYHSEDKTKECCQEKKEENQQKQKAT